MELRNFGAPTFLKSISLNETINEQKTSSGKTWLKSIFEFPDFETEDDLIAVKNTF